MRLSLRIMWVLLLPLVMASPVGAEEKSNETVDLSYITPNALSVAVVYPQRILSYPEMEYFPHEVATAAGLKEAGIDPHDVVSLLGVVEIPVGFPVPGYGVVCKLSKPYDVEKLFPAVKEMSVQEEREGQIYFRARSPIGPSYFMPDERTLIVATEVMMGMMLNAQQNNLEGALKKHATQELSDCDFGYSVLIDPIRPMMMAQLQNAPVPPPFEVAVEIPELVKAIDLKTGLNEEFYFQATIHAPDAEAAKKLETTINQLVDVGKQIFLAEMNQRPATDPVEQAGQQYAVRLMNRVIESVKPKRTDERLIVSGEGDSLAAMGAIGTLTSLLLPAVQQAREAARRANTRNNLKQIAIAMHNYHDVYGGFPAKASFDEEGKPLLSWRVHLLPYLDEFELYKKFNFNEPWDSEHNKKLIPLMPAVLKNPNMAEGEFKTNYLLPVGAGTLFEGNKGKKIQEIIDGSSNTIMAVEADADNAVIWTRPEDLSYDSEEPVSGLGQFRQGVFAALMADGSVHMITTTANKKDLKALFSFAGEEIIQPGDVFK